MCGLQGGISRDSKFSHRFEPAKKAQPVYKSFKGWEQDLSRIRSAKDLPPAAWEYVNFISQELNIPIDILSVGPSRSQTVFLNPLF